MLCNLIGAIVNTILDPLFIFVFHMGMAGAALATITGQILSFALVVLYLRGFKTLPLSLSDLKPKIACWARIAALGATPAFNQVAMMVVQIVMNNTLTYYGSNSVYGSDIPLACAGIISKVNMLFFSFVIGISQGLQPIVSFNFGAQKYDRVKDAYKKAVFAATAISIVAFLCFQFFPLQIIGIFGPWFRRVPAFCRAVLPHFPVFHIPERYPAGQLKLLYLNRSTEEGDFSFADETDYFPASAAADFSVSLRH